MPLDKTNKFLQYLYQSLNIKSTEDIDMTINISRGIEDLQKNPGLLLFDNVTQNLPIFNHAFLNKNVNNSSRIPESGIIKSIHHMQCLGKTNYQDIDSFNHDTLFVNSIGRTISPESLRQRFDIIGRNNTFLPAVDASVAQQLRLASLREVSFFNYRLVPCDIDVTPFANPGVHKEGISCTYKLVDGFAPINAYLGGYAECFDLREGKQHSENGAIPFLHRCFAISKEANVNPGTILVRVDSGHDDHKFVDACEEEKTNYLIKRNLRGASQINIIRFAKSNVKPILSEDGCYLIYRFTYDLKPSGSPNSHAYSVFEVRELLHDKNGIDPYPLLRMLDALNPGSGTAIYEVDSWWTNLPRLSQVGDVTLANKIIGLYRDHATSEQYHSELKTDMNMELLPSKYFSTNKAFLALSAVAFNTLRLIGDRAIAIDKSLQHHKTVRTERIRLRTVIDKFCTIACKVVQHARKICVIFGKHCRYYDTFAKLYQL